MTPVIAPVPFDPATAAGDLADHFNDLSQGLDDYRLADHFPPLTPNQLSRLKDEAQGLEDRAHYFTADAIGATLLSIQSDLPKIVAVTSQANDQLTHLNTVSEAISIATSAVSLGAAIAAGNPVSILAAAEALGEVLTA